MPLGLGVAKQGDQKCLIFQQQPEPWPDVLGLLRLLKREFPEGYRQVWYEVVLANGRGFESKARRTPKAVRTRNANACGLVRRA